MWHSLTVPRNLAPEINRLDVPDVSAADGAAKQTRLNLRWDVSDPNDDELSYTVQVRKEGWPSWIALTETPITEKILRLGHDGVPFGSLPPASLGQRPALEQSRRCTLTRPRERVVHRRSRSTLR